MEPLEGVRTLKDAQGHHLGKTDGSYVQVHCDRCKKWIEFNLGFIPKVVDNSLDRNIQKAHNLSN